jgi:branched-chain amino acid transport system substrate-binding protein
MTAVIPIGSMVPLTGPSAADGREFRNGLALAAEEINANGGILGRSIALHFADTERQTADDLVRAAGLLIEKHQVHAIINGYNIGSQNIEYEQIADAGIIYIHNNTLLQHHDTVMGDPDRYFGCFMGDPAEYWYGQGFIKFISWLRDTGQWRPRNNRLAIISGAKPYSIVIAKGMAGVASHFGWEVAFGPQIVSISTTNWHGVIDDALACDPAVLANTHFYAGDLAQFQVQLMDHRPRAIVYLQYGAMHHTFQDIAREKAIGVIVSTVIGLLNDEIGQAFRRKYHQRFGESATPQVGCETYSALHHYAIVAALAGGTGGPGEFAQNRRVAERLKNTVYRSVVGAIRYHPDWQAAVPYPDATTDPSLGIPHLFYQIQNDNLDLVLIAPEPYNSGRFVLPPWLL